jgi:hypothetical protein
MLYIVDVAYICLYNFTANSWILQKLEVVMSGMAIIMYIMHVNIYITSVHEYIKIIYLFVFYLIVLYRNSLSGISQYLAQYLAVVAWILQLMKGKLSIRKMKSSHLP